MEVKERIAYVRGLLEGADVAGGDATTRTVWDNLLTVCDDLASSVAEVESAQEEMEQYIEGIDADLCDLEDDVYGVEVEEDEEEGVFDEGDDGYVRAECPRCGEEIFFEEDFLYDQNVEISCPECGEILFRGGQHTVAFDENGEYHDEYRDGVETPSTP